MKKVLIVLGMACLLLVGCTEQAEPTTEQTTQVTTEATIPGLYVPESEIESATNGAVRKYDLEDTTCDAITAIGDKVVLISQGKKLNLTYQVDFWPSSFMNVQASALTVAFQVIADPGAKETSSRAVIMPFVVPSMKVSSPSFIRNRKASSPDMTPSLTSIFSSLPWPVVAAVSTTALAPKRVCKTSLVVEMIGAATVPVASLWSCLRMELLQSFSGSADRP